MLLASDFNHQRFIRDYWQKRPLLIRSNGGFQDLIDPATLAGLACETGVDSRIVTCPEPDNWKQRFGPFRTRDFRSLGDSNWTLLVQAVDQWWPEVRKLVFDFEFLPSWRIEDVMVSYATDGGGVGPHFDYYDVFLVQGAGSRLWQVGDRCADSSTLRDDTDLRLLKRFRPRREYRLETGDVLYLPPQFSHNGKSLGNSVCYSIGFRAPSYAQLLDGFCTELITGLSDDRRYTDRLNGPVRSTGELTEAVVNPVIGQLRSMVSDRTLFKTWLGGYLTTPRYPEQILAPSPAFSQRQLARLLKTGALLRRSPFSRFLFTRNGRNLDLFVDGRRYSCPLTCRAALAGLCRSSASDALVTAMLSRSNELMPIILDLLNQGSLELSAEQ